LIHENRREREGCQNRVNYRDRRAQGQTLFLPIYGAPDSNSLIFGEHCAQRKPKHDELMAGFTFHPLALQLLATSLLLDQEIAPTVGPISWSQSLLPHGTPFRRPLTGHCTRAAPPTGCDPCAFFAGTRTKNAEKFPRKQQTAPQVPLHCEAFSSQSKLIAHSPKLKADPPKLSRALLTSNSPNLTLNRAESLTISK
jgi:hypothetical protein